MKKPIPSRGVVPRGWVNTVGDEWERDGKDVDLDEVMVVVDSSFAWLDDVSLHERFTATDLRFLADLLEANASKEADHE